jgi:hypothetical protein
MNARDDACDVAVNLSKLATYYARGADEFLRAYFVLGLHNVRFNARYFVMAHCLELAFKASLANRSVPIRYRTHSLKELDDHLVRQGDSCFEPFRPEERAREVFGRMFQRTTDNFIFKDWIRDHEPLELLVCYEHVADLKYGIDKDGRNILAVMPATVPMNRRFLGYIACARRNFPNRQELDPELIEFVAEIQRQFPALFSGALAFLELAPPGPNH